MGKIRQGEFVDFKELLSDNISLLKKLQEVGQFYLTPLSALSTASKLRSVKDPLSWAFCFLVFLAAKTESQEARELVAYGQLVIHLARKHGGKGWLAYDTLLRQQLAASTGNMCSICKNCAFYDKSMKLFMQLEWTFINITGYRGISNFTCNQNCSAI